MMVTQSTTDPMGKIPAALAPRSEEGFLKDILGIGSPAQHSKRQRVHKPGIGAHQLLECPPVPLLCLLDQGNNFRDLQPAYLLFVSSPEPPQYCCRCVHFPVSVKFLPSVYTATAPSRLHPFLEIENFQKGEVPKPKFQVPKLENKFISLFAARNAYGGIRN